MEGLKPKMTYREMAEHMCRHTQLVENKVNVGRYAKRLGYRVYKPMINRRVCHFYLNDHIESNGNHND